MTTDTATEVRTLTAQDLRALKHADTVTFHMSPSGDPGNPSRSYLRAHRRGEHTSSGFDEYHEIPCALTEVRAYERHSLPEGAKGYTGYVHTYPSDSVIRTILGRMAVGDALALEWWRSNNNVNLRNVHWHQDELRIRIGKKARTEVYLVDTYAGPDNTARMTRIAY